MKRIARQAAEGQPQVREALAGYTELERLLRRHLPPSTATLFARPKETEGGIIEWYSDLDGQPIPFNQLSKTEGESLQRRLQERLDSIEQLAAQLASQGTEGVRQAALLRQAAAYPDLKNLYALNGQPLVTFWGGGQAPIPSAAAMPPVPAVGAAAAGATAMGAGIAPAVARVGARRLWPWVLALLLLGIGAGLWWWFHQEPPESPVASFPETKPVPEVPQPEEKKEEPKPEPELEPAPKEEPKPEEPKPEEPAPVTPEPKPEEKSPEKTPEPVKPVVPVKAVDHPIKPAVVPPVPKATPEPPPKPTPPPPPPPHPLAPPGQREQAAGSPGDHIHHQYQQ